MAGYNAVQTYNFSLPSRSGTVRPFSPSVGSSSGHRSRSRADRDNNSDPGSEINNPVLDLDTNANRGSRIRSPTPTALQMFHFTDDDNAARLAARRSKANLPRPMSTSSSAPALIGEMDLGGCDGADDTDENDHNPGTAADHTPTTPQKEKAKTDQHHLSLDPISPTLSVWPRPMSALMDNSPGKRSGQSAADKDKHTSSIRAQINLTDDLGQNPVGVNVDLENGPSLNGHNLNGPINNTANNSTYNEPPSLARSISIRWGPRLRHISLSEVQAADDAACRVAAVRRERRVFWMLVILALLGVLSCTAAVTLAAAQAAMQVGVEEIGPDPGGGGPIWDVRTLTWLIASLVVCAAAAAGLALATSARCRRRRDGNNGAYSPTEKAILTSLVQSGRRDRAAMGMGAGAESRCSHRFSTLFAHRPPQHLDADGTIRETRDSRAGWVEMDDLDETSEGGNTSSVNRWWLRGRKVSRGSCLPTADGTRENGGNVNVCDEDRNWAKFSQDPVQLRRYVEALEARLAVVDGTAEEGGESGAPVASPVIGRANSTNRAIPGVVRSPAMAVLPRETSKSPTNSPINSPTKAGPWAI